MGSSPASEGLLWDAHIASAAAIAATLYLMMPGAYAAGPADDVSRYPERPVRLLVGFAPGGGTDTTARAIAQRLSAALGQQVVVDNRPGAAGNAGVVKVLNTPDIKSHLFSLALDPAPTTPEAFGAYVKTEMAKWATVVRNAGASTR